MPELPEVEVTRRGIEGPLLGSRVIAVRLGKPLRWALGCAQDRLTGRWVGPVQRRGKYLWLPLGESSTPAAADDTEGLLLHLGMSGSLRWLAHADAPGPHDHFELTTDRGVLRLTDPRRFGAVVWSASLHRSPASTLLARLGAEPFDPLLTETDFHARLKHRRAPIKQVLLAGDVVVGAGNIYACEALFAAGIDPRTPASRLGPKRAARLLDALKTTLARALDLGGSTLRDFHDVHGAGGAFQAQAAVYGRAGLPCPRCGTPVRRLVQGQRSTFLCPRCQRR